MTTKTSPTLIRSAPGIQRDGTRLEANAYSDGLWCRFQRGLPRKMFGYQVLIDDLPELVYGMASYSTAGKIYQHLGSATKLQQVRANSYGTFIGMDDRTPALPTTRGSTSGWMPSPLNLWQFDVLADPIGMSTRILAHPGQNLMDIDNDFETPVFIGDVTTTDKLTVSAMDPVSGGIVVLYPYVLGFGNSGRVDVSDIDNLASPPVDSAFVTGSKIIRGLSLRGGGAGPSGLLWSLDSLIRVAFNSSDPAQGVFAYDTIDDSISVMSSRCIIPHAGIYYWAGVDTFYMFNGVVREIPNSMNVDFFLDNLNFAQRQKVFAYKVPRFGEIWWCFPSGNSLECNHAVIYNYRENCWYDTPLPHTGRSDGIFAKTYNRPFMVGVQNRSHPEDDPKYTIWQHETGVDQIMGNSVKPIRSYFETGDITMLKGDTPVNSVLRVARVEPDFVQVGNLTMTVRGEANARSEAIDCEPKSFAPGPTTTDFQIVDLKDAVRRILRFKFESNTVAGNYQMGRVVGHLGGDGERLTQ